MIEASLKTLIDAIPIPVYFKDMNGCFLGFNRAFENFFDASGKRLLGKTDADILPAEDAEVHREKAAALFERGGVQQYQSRIIAADGALRDVIFYQAVFADDRGTAKGLTGAIIDITDIERGEKELRRSNELLRATIEATPTAIIGLDLDGNVHSVWNPAAEKMLGWSAEEVMGRPLPSVPADRQDEFRGFRERIREGMTLDGVEVRRQRRDGTPIDYSIYASPLRDHQGRITGNIAVLVDITSRKRTEEALREREEIRGRIEHALKFVAQCGWAVSGEKFFPALARYLGEALDAAYVLIGKLAEGKDAAETVALYSRGDIVPNLRYELRDTPCENVAGKKLCCYPRGVRELFPRDGILADMEAESYAGIPLWDSGGRPIGLIAVIDRKPMANVERVAGVLQVVATRAASELERERAEREQAKLQEQFLQAQKMEAVGRLAGGVAHDFNNMLNVILGHAELALLHVPPGMPLHANLQEIRKAAESSSDLTRQLLAFARRQAVAPRVLDVNETVEGMLKMLRRLIGENIDLVWMPGQGVFPVKVDPSQLDQILANLCVNANDAIAGVGRVTIETHAAAFDEAYCAAHPGAVAGEYVLLAVSDNGCGMDKETMGKLFEPFFTTKEKGKGTGLGMATVYGIVKQNNGFIDVISEPGRGSTFRIYLPRSEDEIGRTRETAAPLPVSRRRETVLLVEDNPAILAMALQMLEILKYRVLAASTPGEAIRTAREHTGEIHLLISDVVMPEMNGRELARILTSRYPGQKVLYISGYTEDVIAHHGVLEEGVLLLEKPFSLRELAFKVREALDSE
jgi:PAS domain S-box-containing protein